MADTFERPFDSLTPEEREREKSWIIALYRAGKLPGLNLDLSDDDPMDEDQTDGGHVDGDQVDEDTDDEDQVQGPIVQNVKRKVRGPSDILCLLLTPFSHTLNTKKRSILKTSTPTVPVERLFPQ